MASLTPAAVLIDMDGVLVDSEPLWERVTDEFCLRRGARYDEHDVIACVGRGMLHTAIHLKARYGFSGSPEDHMAEIVAAFAARASESPACAGAEALLRALASRVPLALGTSSPRNVVDASVGARGWLELFDAIVTGSDVAHPKPAPDIYVECARRLGVDAARTVVLEDSVAGATSGRAAGATVIAVRGPALGPIAPELASLAHHTARDLLEVRSMLGVSLAPGLGHGDHPGTGGAV